MKLLPLICAVFFGISLHAQGVRTMPIAPGQIKQKPAVKQTIYLCPKCFYSSTQPIQCPKHKIDLLPEGSYYCKTDAGIFSRKPGICPKCHKKLTKLEKPVKRG